MSINSIMLTGTNGIAAAQANIRVASDNIANVNTAGYARKVANQTSVVSGGIGLGAQVTSITRVANTFLQGASLSASSRSGQAGVQASFLDQAQSLFGDPSEDTSFFAGLDKIYSSLSSAAENPASSLSRSSTLSTVSDFLDNASNVSGSITSLQTEANKQIGSNVTRVNEILKQLSQTNVDISRASVNGGDASGSQNIQSQLLDELSGLMSIQVGSRTSGGVIVRSSDGVQLVGDGGASTLTYGNTNGITAITSTPPNGSPQTIQAGGGSIAGLMQLNTTQLPALSEQLSEFVSKAVEELNRAHNASSSIPAPSTMTGRATGLDLPTAVGGFTGSTRIAVVNPAGVVQHTVDIDFTNYTMSTDGAAAVSYGPAAAWATNFQANLNTALGGAATASFSASGSLSLATGGSNGVVISDDPTNPTAKAGKGFSQFFGMNDLISSSSIADYDTGLKTTDQHGFNPGDVIKMQLTDSAGNPLKAVSVTVPAAGTMASLISALNAGTGLYGSFALDANGRMAFTAAGNQDVKIQVTQDDTHRGANGPSISTLFGIGATTKAARTNDYSVRADIAQNYNLLAYGQFDRSATIGGSPALAAGDGRGALALAQSGAVATTFAAAGDLQSMQMSVTAYASELSGAIGAKATSAKDAQTSADAVASEATTRRAAVEGVNMDEELVNLTTFQQAYNASARLITAAKDMYDTLLGLVQ